MLLRFLLKGVAQFHAWVQKVKRNEILHQDLLKQDFQKTMMSVNFLTNSTYDGGNSGFPDSFGFSSSSCKKQKVNSTKACFRSMKPFLLCFSVYNQLFLSQNPYTSCMFKTLAQQDTQCHILYHCTSYKYLLPKILINKCLVKEI